MPSEAFSRGLVTSRDPASLAEGELQRATNAIYRGASPNIWLSPGRTRYNSVAEVGAIKGLRLLEFDQPDPSLVVPRYILAYVGTTYRASLFTSDTGALSNLATSVGDGRSLDVVAYGENRYLLNGNNSQTRNQVAYLSSTANALAVRPHGMFPVIVPVTVASEASVGWPTGAEWGDGTYFFFVTEVDKSSTVEIEGSYQGPEPGVHSTGTSAITISGTTNGVRVTFPSTVENSNATHFRLYVVGPKENDEWSDLFYVDATAIGDFDIALAGSFTILGNATASTQFRLPTAQNDNTGWTDPNNLFLDDDVLASAVPNATVDLLTFGFTTGSITTVRGIQITAQVRASASVIAHMFAQVSRDGGQTWSAKRPFSVTGTSPNSQWVAAGGKFDLWGFSSWTPGTHLIDGTNGVSGFQVRITTGFTVASGFSSNILQADYIKASVYYSASADLTRGDNYPVTILNVGPLTTVEGSNGPPPVASTGDIFEGSFIVNDVSDGSIIRYSLEDDPDAFPPSYFLNFETKNSDTVTCVRQLHNVLIVGMDNKMVRVNSLPRAEDSEFARGRAFDVIDGVNGCVGPQAMAQFAIPGESELLAFISFSGPRWTNGGVTDTLTEDCDWFNTVNTDKLSTAVLTNYPNIYALRLDYVPKGDSSTYPTKCMWFFYHPSKVKEGRKLAFLGPCDLAGNSATIGNRGGAPILLTGSADGYVHIEDNGNTDPSGAAIIGDVVTRDIIGTGLAGEGRIGPIYIRHGWHDPGAEALVEVYVRDEGEYWQKYGDGSFDYEPMTFRFDTAGTIPGGSPYLINAGNIARIAPDFSAKMFALRFLLQNINGEVAGAASLFALEWAGEQTDEAT